MLVLKQSILFVFCLISLSKKVDEHKMLCFFKRERFGRL